ncbi:LmbE family N-acetylglucosaminyl deacetylase [Sphingomonas jejuensis]|uniref:LmbE family N-acetylglucosaminyl deacetylase n=1 Tax=Sphingomonas jejuensis TaxID=904715 RepID=A0ABX0XJ59_9SPHN|nr:LmbE family N-acetylglucosaminyl deacetylase [Sphingomonas jejuensis]
MPHPDDETLGAGGLIARLCKDGAPPIVAFLTDGSGSHVGAPGWTRRRIAALRRAEARQALRALGASVAALQLGWGDAAPHATDTAAFKRTVRRLVAVCRRHRIGRIAVTWPGEPHCDHEGAATLAAEVSRAAETHLFHYLVWGWTQDDLAAAVGPARVRRIDTHATRARQRRALNLHRSQLGGRILGGEAFCLPRSMRRLVDQPVTLLLEPRHAPRTIDRP